VTPAPWYELRLFVSGASELSARAITDARRLCDEHLDGRFDLVVVDVHEHPAAAHSNRVHVAPTLIKSRPPPARRIAGDLSATDSVLRALELPRRANPSAAPR
jgi:circadian clock protein KaiB